MMDMKIIPMLVKLDFALLPIGDNFTMGINEAIIASQWIECNNIIAMHYDTFGYIVVDQQKAKSEFQNNGINLTFIEIGESINI
jgi:L-ascorbate metabolism protein UlaG (beta-lactamase superfamily)